MALNMSGRGLGFEMGIDDAATPVLTKFVDKVGKAPSSIAPLLGTFGRMGGGLGGIAGSAASATTAVGGLAAALGPLAIAIGIVVGGFLKFVDIANESEMIIRSSVDVFADYERNLAEVGTILGGTAEEMDRVGDSARKMAAEFGVDVQTQLKATYQTMSAGFADAAEGAAIMTTANKLATAGVTDVFNSVDLLTTVLNGYNIAASDSMQASDSLFQAVKFGKTTVDQLSAAMGMVVPSAAAAGASIDETTAAMATLTLAGQSTRMSSVALARALDFLVKLPPKAAGEMQKLGVDLDKLNVRSNGLQGAITELGTALEGDEEALARIGVPVRAFRALMPLATTMSEKFGDVLEGMKDKAGATDEAFERMTNTIDFQRKRWTAFRETLSIELGQTFVPVVKSVLSVLERLIDVVNRMPGPMKDFVMMMTAAALSMPVVAKHGLGFLWTIIKLVVVTSLLTAAFMGLALPLAAIAVLLSPLIALGGLLYLAWTKDFMGIQSTVVGMWDKVKLTFQSIAAFIKGGGVISGPLAEELGKTENTGVLKFAGAVYSIFERIKVVGTSAWEAIKESLDAVRPVIAEMFPDLKGVVDAIFGASDASTDLEKALPIEKFRAAGKAAGDFIGGMIRLGVGLHAFWQRQLKPIAMAFVEVFLEAWPAIKVVLSGIGWVLVNVVLPALKVMVGLMKSAWEMGQKLGTALSPIVSHFAVPLEGGEAGMPQASALEALIGKPALAAPPPAGGQGQAPTLAQGRGQPIVLNVKSEMQVDGDKLGEKVNKYVLDLASAEMIAEPA